MQLPNEQDFGVRQHLHKALEPCSLYQDTGSHNNPQESEWGWSYYGGSTTMFTNAAIKLPRMVLQCNERFTDRMQLK